MISTFGPFSSSHHPLPLCENLSDVYLFPSNEFRIWFVDCIIAPWFLQNNPFFSDFVLQHPPWEDASMLNTAPYREMKNILKKLFCEYFLWIEIMICHIYFTDRLFSAFHPPSPFTDGKDRCPPPSFSHACQAYRPRWGCATNRFFVHHWWIISAFILLQGNLGWGTRNVLEEMEETQNFSIKPLPWHLPLKSIATTDLHLLPFVRYLYNTMNSPHLELTASQKGA